MIVRNNVVLCCKKLHAVSGLRRVTSGVVVVELCCQLASANPGTGKFSVPIPVKSTGVQFVLVLPQDEKS